MEPHPTLTETEREQLMADPRIMQLVVEATVEGEIRGYGAGYAAAHLEDEGQREQRERDAYDAGWVTGYEAWKEEADAIADMFVSHDPEIAERNQLWAQYNRKND